MDSELDLRPGHVEEFGRALPLLESLGNDAKGQGLYSGDGFIAVLAVAEYPGRVGTSAIHGPSLASSQ